MKVFSVVNFNSRCLNINFGQIFGDLFLTYISSVIKSIISHLLWFLGQVYVVKMPVNDVLAITT